ncbi:MAG: FHA domain-containing protein [Cohaesibacter sp.]|nr:FHA domain-containing protein [Cohaesibacter sp.]
MTEKFETQLARLSMAAFAIDGLVILCLSLWMSSSDLVHYLGSFLRQYPWVLTLPVAALLHLFVTEILAAGYSIGRLCMGLSVRQHHSARSPTFTTRIRRFVSASFGIGHILRPNSLAYYNKHPDGGLHSDWLGQVASQRSKAKKPKGQKSPQPRVSVLSGPHAGISVALASGRHFAIENIFIIGTDPAHADLVLNKDPAIAPFQCVIGFNNGHYYIVDGHPRGKQGSRNGTFLGSTKIPSDKFTPLALNSQIRIGTSILSLQD